jgi:hypothetical protein
MASKAKAPEMEKKVVRLGDLCPYACQECKKPPELECQKKVKFGENYDKAVERAEGCEWHGLKVSIKAYHERITVIKVPKEKTPNESV